MADVDKRKSYIFFKSIYDQATSGAPPEKLLRLIWKMLDDRHFWGSEKMSTTALESMNQLIADMRARENDDVIERVARLRASILMDDAMNCTSYEDEFVDLIRRGAPSLRDMSDRDLHDMLVHYEQKAKEEGRE